MFLSGYRNTWENLGEPRTAVEIQEVFSFSPIYIALDLNPKSCYVLLWWRAAIWMLTDLQGTLTLMFILCDNNIMNIMYHKIFQLCSKFKFIIYYVLIMYWTISLTFSQYSSTSWHPFHLLAPQVVQSCQLQHLTKKKINII